MLRALARAGLRRGLLDGRRGWLWVGVAAAGLRLVRRLTNPPERVVHRQQLRPGDALVIAALPRDRAGRPEGEVRVTA